MELDDEDDDDSGTDEDQNDGNNTDSLGDSIGPDLHEDNPYNGTSDDDSDPHGLSFLEARHCTALGDSVAISRMENAHIDNESQRDMHISRMMTSCLDKSQLERQEKEERSAMPTIRQSTLDFLQWQEDNQVTGFSENRGTDALFVPNDRLRAYFEEERVLEILQTTCGGDQDRLPNLARALIAKDCIRTFAILLHVAKAASVERFLELGWHDDILPFTETEKPTGFPGGVESYRDFQRAQYRFCVRPLSTSDRKFSAETILPFKTMEKLSSGITARVFKIELHRCHNRLLRRRGSAADDANGSASHIFALKKFRKSQEASFRHEVAAFEKLGAVQGLVDYYGHFIVGGPKGLHDDPISYNIILEHANAGSLESFWTDPNKALSATAKAHWGYWNQLFGLAKSIERIHTTNPGDDGLPRRAGFHHDIKPSNVLVCHDAGGGASDFPYRFMLADLGLAYQGRTGKPVDATEGPHGTLIYDAPELCCTPSPQHSSLEIAQKADIWSLGAVYSEALIWSLEANRALNRYRHARMAQTVDHCPRFHDGRLRLHTVDQHHQNCVKETGPEHKFTSLVVQVLTHMLDPMPATRYAAPRLVSKIDELSHRSTFTSIAVSRQTLTKPTQLNLVTAAGAQFGGSNTMPAFNDLLDECFDLLAPELESDPYNRISVLEYPEGPPARDNLLVTTQSPPPPANRGFPGTLSPCSLPPTPPPRPPIVTVTELARWKQSKNHGSTAKLDRLSHLLELKGRDIVFIIDDSMSMKQHWEDVTNLLDLLAYAVKTSDSDGIDYLFMSDGVVHNTRTASQLIKHVRRRIPQFNASTDAAALLEQVLGRYSNTYSSQTSSPERGTKSPRFSTLFGSKLKPPRPCTYCVLTDAIWQPRCKVALPIVRLLDRLEGARDDQVGIAFVRFGNDPKGTDRLDYLDHGLKHRHDIPDVVGHEPYDGNVLKMLLGTMMKSLDSVAHLDPGIFHDPDSDSD